MTVVFSSNALYKKFVESLENELHHNVSNKGKGNFTTHLKGRRCSLSANEDECTIVITGPGHMYWRETVFIRLSLGLYRHFTLETNKELSLAHTSTPSSKRNSDHEIPTVSPVLARNTSTSLDGELNGMLLSEIKALREISLNLQGQVDKCMSKRHFVGKIYRPKSNHCTRVI